PRSDRLQVEEDQAPDEPHKNQQQENRREARDAEPPKKFGAQEQHGGEPRNGLIKQSPSEKKNGSHKPKKEQLIEKRNDEIGLITQKPAAAAPKKFGLAGDGVVEGDDFHQAGEHDGIDGGVGDVGVHALE